MNPENFYPWAISQEAFYALQSRVLGHTPSDVKSETFQEYLTRRADEENGYRIHDGKIAIQPVRGVIAQGCGPIAEVIFGCFDLARITAAVDEVTANKRLTHLVLEIDSPGGYTAGMSEAIAALDGLRTARKDLKTLTYATQACSAGYWLAAATDQIHAAPGADLGSIGVYAVTTDLSGMYAQKGVKVQLHTTGKFKGMFTPGVEVKPEWTAWVQERVDATGAAFKSYLTARRPGLAADSMEGQPFEPPYPDGLADTSGKFKTPRALYDHLAAARVN